MAILTEDIITEATQLYTTTKISYKELGLKYGVTTSAIHTALNKKIKLKKVLVDSSQKVSEPIKTKQILTDTQRLEIKQKYDSGSKLKGINKVTFDKLSKEYGVSMSAIRRVCKPEEYINLTELGLNRNSKFTDTQKEEMIADLKAGLSRKTVSEKYGISTTGLTRMVKVSGLGHILVDKKVKLTTEQRKEIHENKGNLTISELIVKYGVSESLIRSILRTHKRETIEVEVESELFNREAYYTKEKTQKYAKSTYEYKSKIKEEIK